MATSPSLLSPIVPVSTIRRQDERLRPDYRRTVKAVSPAWLASCEPLRDLAAKVEKDGKDGNLTVGKLKITDYRVDVMIFLSDVSEKTLAALKKLGFEQTGESKAVKLLIGTLDVRKLEELAGLDAVIRVKPVIAP